MDTKTITQPLPANVAACSSASGCGTQHTQVIRYLQGITIAWMFLECTVALIAAARAHSSVLLAFGSDSVIELLSATVVLLQFSKGVRLNANRASKISGVLLFVLAGFVVLTSLASLFFGLEPKPSLLGIFITVAALIVMPVLRAAKSHFAHVTGNLALAADSVQSATCAYLAAITLVGLAVNAVFHLPWVDSIAALGVTPILITEGRRAIRGESCGCC